MIVEGLILAGHDDRLQRLAGAGLSPGYLVAEVVAVEVRLAFDDQALHQEIGRTHGIHPLVFDHERSTMLLEVGFKIEVPVLVDQRRVLATAATVAGHAVAASSAQ